ncbi:MaoC family dehydratase [Microbacterium immunditiarum]|uniref:Acyl dehydratase n=1 Tax=Microbacterium immunditiarum TaxID=337480 RepID=A0A7Y9GM06_9MICO|nr:MaoC family dehydratase [Microbacterium immunditiarum]NYE18806.1 acyl dehydratase [Microbacterium immunditiarum]
MRIRYDELESMVGKELGPSEWLPIPQSSISTFAGITNDHYWLHVDTERAATSAFGGTIAHGFLTLSMISALWPSLLWITDSPMQMNYGLDRVRFTAPVRSGSRIRMRAKLTEVIPSDSGCRMKVDLSLEREGEEKPAVVATLLMQVARPDGSGGHGDPNR